MKEVVAEILNKLRTSLKADGGDLELVEITDDGRIIVRLKGFCGTCHSDLWMYRLRIERAMSEKLPDVKVIVKV